MSKIIITELKRQEIRFYCQLTLLLVQLYQSNPRKSIRDKKFFSQSKRINS